MQARILGSAPAATFNGAVIDSRRVEGGELFFALPGEHTDGHDFAVAALEAGAAAAVVERRPPGWDAEAGTLLLVDSVLAALHDVTRHLRSSLPQRVAAVTGSAGKTTTKDMLAVLLAPRYRVAATPGNFNNLLGFPLTLLNSDDDAQWLVAEMGMSEPGELGQISRLGRPDVVVLTNIGAAHLERLGSIEGVAEAKAEIFAGLAEDGAIVANAEDAQVARIAARHAEGHPGCRLLWFGLETQRSTALRVRELDLDRGDASRSRFVLVAGAERQEVELPLAGRHNVLNFLAAATVAHDLDVSLAEIAAAAASLRAAEKRGRMVSLPGGARVYDDSYNSNPEAAIAALRAVAKMPSRRHIAVLGAMLELGAQSDELHRRVGREAVDAGYDLVLGVGVEARPLVETVRQSGGSAEWLAAAAPAGRRLNELLRDGDLVLLKGSRGVALEDVLGEVTRHS